MKEQNINKRAQNDKRKRRKGADIKKAERTLHVSILFFALSVMVLLLSFSISDIKAVKQYIKHIDRQKTIKNSEEGFEKIQTMLKELDNIYKETYFGEIDYEKISEYVMQGYIVGTGDRYGTYLTKEREQKYQETMGSSLVGVGFEARRFKEGVRVIDVYVGSAAEEVGLQDGDLIKKVDEIDVREEELEAVTKRIRGAKGTQVRLTVERDGEEKIFDVTRREVTTESIKTELWEEQGQKIGYVKIKHFTSKTDEEFKKDIEALEQLGADGYIFDLRDNGGGELATVIKMCDLLLPEGIIVRIEDKNGEVKKYLSKESSIDKPMVALINYGTASASELFTASLRDYGKVVVIGEQSYGKGMSSIKIPFGDGAVSVANAKYYTRSGESVDRVGIKPDIDFAKKGETGEEREERLQKQYREYQKYVDELEDEWVQKGIEVLTGEKQNRP